MLACEHELEDTSVEETGGLRAAIYSATKSLSTNILLITALSVVQRGLVAGFYVGLKKLDDVFG